MTQSMLTQSPAKLSRGIPTTMRAARFDRAGGPEVLDVRVVPTSAPRAGELLVRVHASGLNPKDALCRLHARFPRGANRSLGVGFDFAGEVAAMGPGVSDLFVGSHVWGFLDGRLGGAAAEFVVVSRDCVSAMPKSIGWEEAGALPLVASTALQALRDVARIRVGDRVLIKGASGGVGSAAIQIASAFGAQVTALVRDKSKTHFTNLDDNQLLDEAELRTSQRTFDVFLDCVGGTRYRTLRRHLPRGSRWVTVAPDFTVFALAPLSPVLAPLLGAPRFGFVMVRPRKADLVTLAELVDSGQLRMSVAERYALDQIADAHRALEGSSVRGKRVLRIVEDETAIPQRSPIDPASRFRARIESMLAEQGVHGASVAVVDERGLRWADGFGLARVATARPARADTVYHVFSGTKLFTAVAVMQLVEQERILLDDPISAHLSEAQQLHDVTIRQLLSHQSGLAESLRGLLATTFPGDPVPTAIEALDAFPIKRVRPVGARVEYRNVNYALLGALIERVSGVGYRDFIETNVLKPLGMAARFTMNESMRAHAATGYMDRLDPMRLVLRMLYPSVSRRLYGERVGSQVALVEYDLSTAAIGGLIASAEDLARFLHDQLTASGRVLTSESTRLMQRQSATGAAGIESRVGVGLGWKIGLAGNRAFLNHEGGGAGYTSELRLYPQQGVGVAIAMNAMRMPRTMRLAHRIAELVSTRD